MYKTISVIVAWWKKRSFSTYSNEFIFLSICVYLFENCPSQFLSCWESAEPAFCSEKLSYKNQNKTPFMSCDRKSINLNRSGTFLSSVQNGTAHG